MIKLSTIMPVYNMSNYIEETVSNWEEQTLKEKQLICINDCSNDNTIYVLEQLAKKYRNIKLIPFQKMHC